MFYLDSKDEYLKVFGIELLTKFFQIKFEEGFKAENILIFNLPNVLWDKLYSLTNFHNYKIAIFATFIIQVYGDKDYINQTYINKRVSSTLNINSDIIHIKLDKINFWLEPAEIENLFIFIRDKIIFEIKIKNTQEKEFNTIPSIHHVEDKDFDQLIKVDEINDYIDYRIPELKEKEDNTSLEDLGVLEVEDEIFENFDEDNIPVIKNIYQRKKGSAEKLKTNQTARNLLMSNLNKYDRPNEPERRTTHNEKEFLNDIQMRKSKNNFIKKI
jgi:hypothetical protein